MYEANKIQPRIVNIAQTMDFTGSEGTTSGKGCAAWGTGSTCQTAINANDWCTNYQPDAPVINVKYDTAGPSAIRVGSNKSILGVKDKGVLIGKGLQMFVLPATPESSRSFSDL